MSRDKEAARRLNSLASESLALFGTLNGSALSGFLHDYFCEDDPGNESQGRRFNFLPYFAH